MLLTSIHFLSIVGLKVAVIRFLYYSFVEAGLEQMQILIS